MVYIGDLESTSHIPDSYENEDWSPVWESEEDKSELLLECNPGSGSSGKACNDVVVGCFGKLSDCKVTTDGIANSIVSSEFECGRTDGPCNIDCKSDACSVE